MHSVYFNVPSARSSSTDITRTTSTSASTEIFMGIGATVGRLVDAVGQKTVRAIEYLAIAAKLRSYKDLLVREKAGNTSISDDLWKRIISYLVETSRSASSNVSVGSGIQVTSRLFPRFPGVNIYDKSDILLNISS